MPKAEALSPERWVRAVRSERPPAALDEYLRAFEAFFDHHAAHVDDWRSRNSGYHRAVATIARFYIPRDARVLEVGCGTGDLLAALEPAYGVGVDLSGEMVRRASARHPTLSFHWMPAEQLSLPGQTFDYIILSDLLGYLYDIRAVLERVATLSHPGTRIVINWYSRLWQPVIHLLDRLGLKAALPYLNWTTVEDVQNLLRVTGLEPVRSRGHILLPLRLGPLSWLANRFLAHFP